MAPFFTGIHRSFFRSAGVSGPTIRSTGGTLIASGTTLYHVFTAPGTFTISDTVSSAEVLIVAGGGGGGSYYYGGGGGAGGVVHGPSISLSAGSYPVVIGAGGPGSTTYPTPPSSNGSNSSFNAVTAIGGGGGGSYSPGLALAGGSSGGSSYYDATPVAVTPQPVPASYVAYGNIGGYAPTAGSGGGGAGSVGSGLGPGPNPATGGSTYYGGPGGSGRAFPSFPAPILSPAIPGSPNWSTAVGPTGLFGGGGGGGAYYTYPGGSGGPGGGGAGGGNFPSGPVVGSPGVNYTGGGGGGTDYASGGGGPPYNGGKGGDGIVIVKFNDPLYQVMPTPPPSPISATGGTTYTPGNGYTYHTFTSPGTFTVNSGNSTIQVLVVAGGGGGNGGYGGGGGAGGVIYDTAFPVTPGSYTVSVGSGGAFAASGSDSSFGPLLVAKGGGRGGLYPTTAGAPGGSGGGGAEPTAPFGPGIQPSQPKPATATNYGNPGGPGSPLTGAYASGGGGGAAAAGGAGGNTGPGGSGGAGQPFPGFEYPIVGLSPVVPTANSPTNNHYGGGGAGWGYPASGQIGGAGGGGRGGYGTAYTPGVNGLGGGGGGNFPSPAGTGGNGIVIVRYQP